MCKERERERKRNLCRAFSKAKRELGDPERMWNKHTPPYTAFILSTHTHSLKTPNIQKNAHREN